MKLEQGASMKQLSAEFWMNTSIIHGLESELQKSGSGQEPSLPCKRFCTCIWKLGNCHFVEQLKSTVFLIIIKEGCNITCKFSLHLFET